VPKGGAEDFAFLADEADSGHSHGDVLRGDHLSGDCSGRIGYGEQYWAQVKLMGRCDLQIAEEHVAGGVATAQEAGEPAEESAEDGERRPYASDRCAEGVGHSRIVIEVGECDDGDHCEAGNSQLPESLQAGVEECASGNA